MTIERYWHVLRQKLGIIDKPESKSQSKVSWLGVRSKEESLDFGPSLKSLSIWKLTIFAGVFPFRGSRVSCMQWVEVRTNQKAAFALMAANHSPVLSQVTGSSSGLRGVTCCCSWVTRGLWPILWPSAVTADTSSGNSQPSALNLKRKQDKVFCTPTVWMPRDC